MRHAKAAVLTPLAVLLLAAVSMNGCDKKLPAEAKLGINVVAAQTQEMASSFALIKGTLQTVNAADKADFDRYATNHLTGLQQQGLAFAALQKRGGIGDHLGADALQQLNEMAKTTAVRVSDFKQFSKYVKADDKAVADFLDSHQAALDAILKAENDLVSAANSANQQPAPTTAAP